MLERAEELLTALEAPRSSRSATPRQASDAVQAVADRVLALGREPVSTA